MRSETCTNTSTLPRRVLSLVLFVLAEDNGGQTIVSVVCELHLSSSSRQVCQVRTGPKTSFWTISMSCVAPSISVGSK